MKKVVIFCSKNVKKVKKQLTICALSAKLCMYVCMYTVFPPERTEKIFTKVFFKFFQTKNLKNLPK